MKKKVTRIIALALAAVMVFSLAACGGGSSSSGTQTTTTAAAKETTAAAKTEETTTAAAAAEETTAAPAPESKLDGPVTITVWHSRGSGEQLEEMQRVVEAFNSTNDKQITVVEEYVGTNQEVNSKVATAIAAGNNGQIALLGFTSVGELAAEGILADMKPFADRDGFDLDNILSCFQPGLVFDGQLLALPYIRSASVLFYNKDMFKAAGYDTVPEDIYEFSEALKKIKDAEGVFGVGIQTQPDFVEGAWMKSINGIGDVTEDGLHPLSLEDGSVQEVTQWWLDGVKDGTIMKYTVKEAGNNFKNAFYAGELASFAASCAGMTSLLKHCRESGINVGVAPLPGFRGKATSSTGGSNMAIIAANSTDAQIEASWEFLKFLISDEQMGYNCTTTGYLPVTYSAGDSKAMQDFWAVEENGPYKDAYEVLKIAKETYPSPYIAAWQKELTKMWDNVILEESMTVEEGIKSLEDLKSIMWP